jgi:hypothetical protein
MCPLNMAVIVGFVAIFIRLGQQRLFWSDQTLTN